MCGTIYANCPVDETPLEVSLTRRAKNSKRAKKAVSFTRIPSELFAEA